MIRRFQIAPGMLALSLSLAPAAVPTRPAHLAQPVDVNRATEAELMQVPGMTAVWAARIVRFRPYRTKLDLLQQGIVTPEVYQRIRDSVIAHRDR